MVKEYHSLFAKGSWWQECWHQFTVCDAYSYSAGRHC